MAEKEYIEREAIEKAFAEEIRTNYLDDYAKGFQAALLAIMSIPSADVAPVVHCKDCEYNNECSVQDFGEMHQNDFCSHGKRRMIRWRVEHLRDVLTGARMDGDADANGNDNKTPET